jgi:hypothetical protein
MSFYFTNPIFIIYEIVLSYLINKIIIYDNTINKSLGNSLFLLISFLGTTLAYINNRISINKKKNKRKFMKWLEIIELRSISSNHEMLESLLQSLIKDVEKETKKQPIKAYSQIMINTDFRIHLFHDSKKMENSGSPLGLSLASALKDFGLVNHSVWIEMHGK